LSATSAGTLLKLHQAWGRIGPGNEDLLLRWGVGVVDVLNKLPKKHRQ